MNENTTITDEENEDDVIDTVTSMYNLTQLAGMLFNQESNATCAAHGEPLIYLVVTPLWYHSLM